MFKKKAVKEKKYCILLSGAPLCGKDSSADYLVKHYGFQKCELKSPMYGVVASLFNLESFSYFTDRKLKEKKIKQWDMSPREMLQHVGYEMKRIFGGDIWCKNLLSRIGVDKNIVIPDNRYGDENEFFKQHFEVISIRINRKGCDGSKVGIKNFISEKNEFPTDYVIENHTKDFKDLYQKIDTYIMGNGIEKTFEEKEYDLDETLNKKK